MAVFWTDARLTYPTLDFLTSFDPQPENGVWWYGVRDAERVFLTSSGIFRVHSDCRHQLFSRAHRIIHDAWQLRAQPPPTTWGQNPLFEDACLREELWHVEAQRDVPNETCFQREERLRQARERAEIAWTKAQDAASGGFLRSEEAWLRANRPDWDAGFHTRDVDVIHQKRALGTDESATVPNALLSLQTDLSWGSPAGRRRLRGKKRMANVPDVSREQGRGRGAGRGTRRQKARSRGQGDGRKNSTRVRGGRWPQARAEGGERRAGKRKRPGRGGGSLASRAHFSRALPLAPSTQGAPDLVDREIHWKPAALPAWAQLVHPSHATRWIGGLVVCEHCGGTTSGRMCGTLLTKPCRGFCPKGSRGRRSALVSGRLPTTGKHFTAWPDGRTSPDERRAHVSMSHHSGQWHWAAADRWRQLDRWAVRRGA